MTLGPLQISFAFRWYDLWVGFYYDRVFHWLYFCPLPCCAFKIGKSDIGEKP